MRRNFKPITYSVAAFTTVALVLLGALLPPLLDVHAGVPGDPTPVPIPGFVTIPPFPIEIHAFFPGFLGEDVNHEPATLTDYRGFTALAYHAGAATDNNGQTFDFFTDLRVFQGEYVSRDGTHHRGTFALI